MKVIDIIIIFIILCGTIWIVKENQKEVVIQDEKNEITQENVLDLFFDVTETSTFVSQKMYYEYINKNTNKYYVQGYIQENQLFDDELLTNQDYETVYFIVYLDSNENIFSIEPYDGKIFKEGLDEK